MGHDKPLGGYMVGDRSIAIARIRCRWSKYSHDHPVATGIKHHPTHSVRKI
ncbi:hypothetical protein SBX64_06465 [Vibrio rhizosphaerae]|uniref:Uncharacterized protein n=1 Tax=Vibrio rhizosphaerae TaxID=398736 RepID=A0ABU4IRZ8_9VIBR|nr:hypothetical protein [Vibrio rhizosphaerae]MDW6092186.1 hypothetical protein [Vibrio rhizosphaerae]